jgi:hypothetical protein
LNDFCVGAVPIIVQYLDGAQFAVGSDTVIFAAGYAGDEGSINIE